MIQIEEKNGKKIVTVERGRGTEIFLINATVSDALIRHIFSRGAGESAGERPEGPERREGRRAGQSQAREDGTSRK